MTLLLPIAVTTVLTLAGVLGGLAIIAYILKMRRRRFEVPFSTLWHRVLQEKDATSLWKHMRRILSLLLQLAILALLLVAALDPQLGSADDEARNLVIIIDASASMKTVDEGPDGTRMRMAVAREKAHELLDAMGGGDSAMIMRMDGQTTPLSRFDSDVPMLHKVVDSVEPSDTPADLRRALGAAADALRERRNPLVVIIGDGAYPKDVLDRVVLKPAGAPDATGASGAADAPATPARDGGAAAFADKRLDVIDLTGIEASYIPIGHKDANVGIVSFNARRYLTDKTSYSVFIEVQNFGSEAAGRKLVVYSGDNPVDVKTITLKPGERLREIYPNLSGGQANHLRAELQSLDSDGGADQPPADIFPLDDRAFALLPARKKQLVLLVTKDNLYLEGAMLVYDSIQVDKLLPEEYDQAVTAGTLPEYDAVVFDDYTPEQLPPIQTHLLYFRPGGENSPFTVRGTVKGPRINEVDEGHPVMRWVVMSDVNIDESDIFSLDRSKGEVSLASYVRDTLVAAKKDGQRKIIAFGFSLASTDLTLRVAFPLLLVNTLDWFAGDEADLITTYRTGHRFRVAMDGTYGVSEVEVNAPKGKLTRAPVVDGQATFYGNWIGIHRLVARQDGQVVAQVELAANLANPEESLVAPNRELSLGGQTLKEPEGFTISHRRSLWGYLALLVVLLLAVEWITYNRRVTV